MRPAPGVEPRLVGGRYAADERLGRGGMGEVRAATDDVLGRRVAVKLLRADLAEQPSARHRFETEARAAAGLTHPNIVTVYDTGEDGGQPFLVMELLPGRTLADEIKTGPLSIPRAVDVGCAVLSALGAAHRAGVVHRDVKPGNVLLTRDDVPKVTDFGIAKTADESDSTATLTGELLATPAYLAPERLAGQAASPASDIYAVGVLLYEALAGRSPYPAREPAAILEAVARGEVEPLPNLRGDVPPEIVAVIERAMARDPSERFGSADAMADALGAASAHARADDPSIIASATQAPTISMSPEGSRDGETAALTSMPVDGVIAPPPRPAPPPRYPRPRTRRRARVHEEPREPLATPITSKPKRRVRLRRSQWWAIATIIVVAIVVTVVLVTRGSDSAFPPSSATQPTSASPAGAAPLPANLDRALQRLEQSTR